MLIASELWKKLEPEDSNRGGLLLNLAVQCLDSGRWAMARGLSYFVMNDNNETELTKG